MCKSSLEEEAITNEGGTRTRKNARNSGGGEARIVKARNLLLNAFACHAHVRKSTSPIKMAEALRVTIARKTQPSDKRIEARASSINNSSEIGAR